jgi:hypothetical protein
MSDVALTFTIFHTLSAVAILGLMVFGVISSMQRRD